MFTINGIKWNIVFVPPNSKELLRSDKTRTVGVTDWNKRTVFLSDRLKGGFLRKVANYEANPTEWKFLGDKPALIDFYASWCGPCKALSPVLDELAKDFDGKVDIYKVNVDNEKELTSLFRIRSVPTLVFVPMQGDPQVTAGALNRIQLRQALNNLLVS